MCVSAAMLAAAVGDILVRLVPGRTSGTEDPGGWIACASRGLGSVHGLHRIPVCGRGRGRGRGPVAEGWTEGTFSHRRNWDVAEACRSTDRQQTAAAAPPTPAVARNGGQPACVGVLVLVPRRVQPRRREERRWVV